MQNKAKANTFKELYELWFDTYQRTVKETTSMKTELRFRLHILPIFGDAAIDKIDVKLCQKAVNEWEKEVATFKQILRSASKIMDFAINLDMITRNPFKRIIIPARKETAEKKLKFYTSEQLETMLNYLNDRVTHASGLPATYNALLEYSLIRLLAFSGMRVGEALALDYNDFNFEAGTVAINKTITETKKGSVVSSSPKTKSSNRVIPLDAKTLRIMKQWQLKQRELLFSNRVKDVQTVFSNFDGALLVRTTLYHNINARSKKIGLPVIGLHGYRHTHASMLFEAGVSMKEAQVRLGHSKIDMTMNIYTHVTEKAKVETVEKLARFASF